MSRDKASVAWFSDSSSLAGITAATTQALASTSRTASPLKKEKITTLTFRQNISPIARLSAGGFLSRCKWVTGRNICPHRRGSGAKFFG